MVGEPRPIPSGQLLTRLLLAAAQARSNTLLLLNEAINHRIFSKVISAGGAAAQPGVNGSSRLTGGI